MGPTATKSVIKYWRTQDPNTIKYCVMAKFDEYNTIITDGKLSLGSKLSQGELKNNMNQEDCISINHQKHPMLENKIETSYRQKEVQSELQ